MYNVISGLYPTSETDVVALAAMQFQAKFGAFNRESHKPGFLTRLISEYVPADHLIPEVQPVEAWEEKIFHKLAFSTTSTPRESYNDYLRKREYYGSTFFVVRQRFDRNLPKTLFLAVSRRGILLLRVPKSHADSDLENIASFKLADVYRWAYKVRQERTVGGACGERRAHPPFPLPLIHSRL